MTYQECFYLDMGQELRKTRRKKPPEPTLSSIVVSFIGCGSILALAVMLVMALAWIWEEMR